MTKENKEEGRSEVLLGPDNNIEFLKHFMNILLKNESTETQHTSFYAFGMINLQHE